MLWFIISGCPLQGSYITIQEASHKIDYDKNLLRDHAVIEHGSSREIILHLACNLFGKMLSTFLIGDREISGNLKPLKEDLSSKISAWRVRC